MRTWNYTKNGELTAGINEEGFPYFQFKIQGWNDNHHFSDVEDVVTLKAVIQNGGAELLLQSIYASEDALACPFIQERCEETEQILLHEAQLWLHAAQ
ncbi:hypothetical protein [Ectobacillus funiculus]|uniref:hypothetical protein n=1 Tax=Ectobacillus funiculus TaxID=137993 RepID=UPI00101DDB01|nr:hypothetical protein [Ectobacillus funiculus]